MSFLVRDEDPQSTLAAALALIDACDCTTTSCSSSSSSLSTAPCSPDDHSADVQATGVLKGNMHSKHHPRVRRQDVEIKRLRHELKELECTRSQLHTEKERCAQQTADWLETARAQTQARRTSEALNAQLKDAVARHYALQQALERVVQERVVPNGFHLLSDLQKRLLLRSNNDCAALDYSQEHGTMAELRVGTDKLHALVDVVFGSSLADVQRSDAGLSCTSKMKQDPMFGTFLERRAEAFVNLPFAEVGQTLWQAMTTVYPSAAPLHFYVKKHETTSSSCETSFMIVFEGPSGPVEMHGLSYKRRVEEADRIVHVCSSVVFAPASDQVFRERGWVVVAPDVEGQGKNAAVFRTCYQVFSDYQCGERRKSSLLQQPHEADDDFKELVLHVLSTRPRGAHQRIHKMVRECAGTRLQ